MRTAYTLVIIFIIQSGVLAQSPEHIPKAIAKRVSQPVVIDGVLEDLWDDAPVIRDFSQFRPLYNRRPSQPTEVRILYDDHSIYIAAKMFDSSPDSILRQSGNRDDDLNADYFSIEFDTYNLKQDAYLFRVYSSGVQADSRHADGSFDAVWHSATRITANGWIAEISIPYSALRFPKTSIQTWGMQITRSIRRHREFSQWSLESQGTNNKKYQWGELHGIQDISPPLRISLSPYLSSSVQHYPYNVEGRSNFSYVYNGGADLKYGINESFTLDITLMPDFSQVQSDNRVKNLSAFETTYSEQRPFFNEAIDLFRKGGLFYSRRIGRTPRRYNMVNNFQKQGYQVLENPEQTSLINAVKLSGRNKNGLAIGIFNAITDASYAVYADSTGKQERMLTEPLSNYSIIVLDQSLNNNGNIYVVNTNVSRAGGFGDANVTGAGGQIMDKSQRYRIAASIVANLIWYGEEDIQSGSKKGMRYNLGAGKSAGVVQFWLSRTVLDKNFDINSMGVSFRNNEVQQQANISYNLYNPWWKIRDGRNTLTLFNRRRHSEDESLVYTLTNTLRITNLNYLSIWQTTEIGLSEEQDMYEARAAGRFYIWPKKSYANFGFSSDYRKAFALDGQIGAWSNTEKANEVNFWIRPIFRIGNRISLNMQWQHAETTGQRGFAAFTGDSIVFGRRNIKIDESTINFRYIFRNNLSLGLRLRHYWNRGVYNNFYLLDKYGRLTEYADYSGKHDYDFNSFNVDMVFSWEFAPGSNLTLVWKNDLLEEENKWDERYFHKLSDTFGAPQYNTFSIKLLYYIDYNSINRMIIRKK